MSKGGKAVLAGAGLATLGILTGGFGLAAAPALAGAAGAAGAGAAGVAGAGAATGLGMGAAAAAPAMGGMLAAEAGAGAVPAASALLAEAGAGAAPAAAMAPAMGMGMKAANPMMQRMAMQGARMAMQPEPQQPGPPSPQQTNRMPERRPMSIPGVGGGRPPPSLGMMGMSELERERLRLLGMGAM